LSAISSLVWIVTILGAGRARGGNAIAADERIGEDENLAAVQRIGERFDVAGHGGVENHLATDPPNARPDISVPSSSNSFIDTGRSCAVL
jgi:hypothetical protein